MPPAQNNLKNRTEEKMEGNLFLLLKHPLLFLKELEATLKATNLKRETSKYGTFKCGTSIYGTAIYKTSMELPYIKHPIMEHPYGTAIYGTRTSYGKVCEKEINRSRPTSSSRCLLVSSNPSTSGCLVKSCLQRNKKVP